MKAALSAAQALVNAAENQAQIDDAANALNKAIKALKKVAPIDDDEPDTNLLAIILTWGSIGINVATVAIVVVYFILKKKKAKDNVPMVDYAAEDDEDSNSNEAN
jgi:predicted PurR-regulated permease PerM